MEYQLRSHNVRVIRAIFNRLCSTRDKLYLFLAKCIVIILKISSVRLMSMTKERIVPLVKMPYQLPIFLRANSFREFRRAGFCFREESTTKWIEECSKEGGVLYDIGANVGAVSLLYAANVMKNHKVVPESSIIAFEPTPETYSALCGNISVNRWNGRILPLNIPMSDKSSMGFLNITSESAGTSGHSFNSSLNKAQTTKDEPITIPMISQSIDRLVNDFKLPSPDWLKIDIDGLDFIALKGAEKLLKAGKIKSILIEKNEHEDEIRSFIKNFGFIEVNIEERISENINLRFDRP